MTQTAGILVTLLLSSPLAAGALTAQAQPQPTQQEPISVAGLKKALGSPEKVSATIVAIDQDEQVVVLKGDSGVERSIYVGPDLSKLKHLKAGDRITLTYHMSLATHVVPPGVAAHSAAVSAAVGTGGADRPGGTIAEQRRWILTVNSVDQEKGTVTVTTGQGRTLEFKAADKSRIAQLKPNDRIEAVLTAALVVDVEPAAR